MRFKSPNGSPIIGTLETLQGCANATEYDDKGEPEYEGETTIWWDEQRTVTRGKSYVYVDEDGQTWTFDQLVPDDEDDEDEDGICRTCGAEYAQGGDGFDGECPDCADKTDQKLHPENYE